VRRRFDVDDPDRVRDGPKNERWPGGATLWRHFRASKCLGRWSFRGRGWGGWAERETLPVAVGGLFRAEVWEEHITVSSGLELHD